MAQERFKSNLEFRYQIIVSSIKFINLNNTYFDNMVSQIYLSELQRNKANTSETEAAFLDLHLFISFDIVIPKFTINETILILKMLIFPFLDGDVSRFTSYGVIFLNLSEGAQLLSGRVLDSRPRGRGFEPHRRHFVVVLEQDTCILA